MVRSPAGGQKGECPDQLARKGPPTRRASVQAHLQHMQARYATARASGSSPAASLVASGGEILQYGSGILSVESLRKLAHGPEAADQEDDKSSGGNSPSQDGAVEGAPVAPTDGPGDNARRDLALKCELEPKCDDKGKSGKQTEHAGPQSHQTGPESHQTGPEIGPESSQTGPQNDQAGPQKEKAGPQYEVQINRTSSDKPPRTKSDTKLTDINDDTKGDESAESWYSWAWKAPQRSWFMREPRDNVPVETNSSPTDKEGTPGPAEDSGNSSKERSQSSSRTPEGQSPGPSPDFRKQDTEGGGWAFWTRKNRHTSGTNDGELAISGTETEHHPREAILTEAGPRGAKDRKRHRTARASVLVPDIDSIFEWQTQGTKLMSTLSKLGVWNAPKLYRVAPPAVRNVVVIGIHGYFPTRFARAILGEPTGTSVKFVNEAASVVEEWGKTTGQSINIDKIALEGEGKINHRVDVLHELLMNWKDLLRQADFIFFAVHSQGAVVAVILLAQLISEKLLDHQRVGVLSMAGACLGPVPNMDQTLLLRAISKIEHESLMELFELQRPDSPLSLTFSDALTVVLKHGIKVVLVGSADDQLVPLYSALCVNVDHPNLYRVAYFDGADVAPQVIAPLLSLALQRRNMGYSDDGVIVELSIPLVGAITGKGHSKLYSSDEVYKIALEMFLETSYSFNYSPVPDPNYCMPKNNPFILPWSLHALLSDSESKSQFEPTVNEIYEQFKDWRPQTKALKDLKYRMDAIQQVPKL